MRKRHIGYAHVVRPSAPEKIAYSFGLDDDDYKSYGNPAVYELFEKGYISHPVSTLRYMGLVNNYVNGTSAQATESVENIYYDNEEQLHKVQYRIVFSPGEEVEQRRYFPMMAVRNAVELKKILPEQTLLTVGRVFDGPLDERLSMGTVDAFTELNFDSKTLNYIDGIYNHVTDGSGHELTLLKLECWTRQVQSQERAGSVRKSNYNCAFSVQNVNDLRSGFRNAWYADPYADPSAPVNLAHYSDNGDGRKYVINKNSPLWRLRNIFVGESPDNEIDVSSISAYLHSKRILRSNAEYVFHETIETPKFSSKYIGVGSLIRDLNQSINYGKVLRTMKGSRILTDVVYLDMVDASVTSDMASFTHSQYITAGSDLMEFQIPMIAKQHVKYKGFLIASGTYTQEQMIEKYDEECTSVDQLIDYVSEVQRGLYRGKNLMVTKKTCSEDVALGDAHYGLDTLPEWMLNTLYERDRGSAAYPLTFGYGYGYTAGRTQATPYSIVCFTPLYVV